MRLYRAILYLVLALSFLPVAAQPAHAQATVNVNSDFTQLAEWAWDQTWEASKFAYTQAEDIFKDTQAALQGVNQSWGNYLSTLGQTLIANTNNMNARGNSDLSVIQKNAADHASPSGMGACPIVMSTTDKDNEHDTNRKMAAALSQGQQNRPDTLATIAADLQTKCALGFIDTSNATDPDSAQYKRMFPNACTPAAGVKLHAGADRDIASLLGPLEYFVPDNFPPQQTDASYKPLPTPLTGSQSDYSAFAAAYTFCQNTTPHQSPAQPGTGAPTAGDMNAGARRDASAGISLFTNACYRSLANRMQFPSSSTYPALDAAGNVTTRYKQQFHRCEDDAADNTLSADQLALCAQNGRSDLQADHDESYILGATSPYTVKVLSVVSRDMQELLKAQAKAQERAFDRSLDAEEQKLIAAKGVVDRISMPPTSPLDQARSPIP